MPLLALCMNFCWETLSLVDYIVRDGTNLLSLITYGLWTLLDIGIIITYTRYGKKETNDLIKGFIFVKYTNNSKWFIIRTLSVLMIVLSVILLMYKYVDNWKGYFVFPNNLIMSVQFLIFPFIRQGSRGQSMSIAITKCIGTLCATMTMILSYSNAVIIGIGLVCFAIDIMYIVLLLKTIRQEESVPQKKVARW